ncbi:MAG: arsenate reductase (glutaredoxin) [Bacteroidia bacterium]
MKIYHNPDCSKSRGSCEILNARNADFEIRNYITEPLSKEELIDLLKKLDMPAHDLVRKGEAVFETSFKNKTLSEEDWIDAMVQFPILIQRPIIVRGDKAVIGRPIERVLELLEGE